MIAALLSSGALALAAAPGAHAVPGPWAFEYTGQPQTFTVPPEVHKLSMTVVGGAGGRSDSNLGGGPGGVSGLAYGRFTVHPGEELVIWVGGEGRPGPEGGEAVSWGWGCGASGGEGNGISDETGGGGGAASAVTEASEFVAADCETRPDEEDILIVGAGGGGGGANDFIPPPNAEISFGGTGGSGGDPAGGGNTGGLIAPGGCGGCTPFYHGQAGAPIFGGGGGGGGGGGYRGGGGGGVANLDGGGGGGGGLSFVHPRAEEIAFLAGYGAGDGTVLLSALETEFFQCTGSPQSSTAPEGSGQVHIEADGGVGGSRGHGLGGPGGSAGNATALVPVDPGDELDLYVGCQGARSPGWGYDSGGPNGQARARHALDGASGGGSSGVFVNGRLAMIAAGGGGGGGYGMTLGKNEDGSGYVGGAGGSGGYPASDGAKGEPEDDWAGGDGGLASVIEGGPGGTGGDAPRATLGGGGGGGGGGWFSGEGGRGGSTDWTLVGGGGGGGGGGMTGVSTLAKEFTYGTSTLGGNGLVELTYVAAPPAAISVHGGSKQQVTIGGELAQPLAALVTYANGRPVAGAPVTFTLPGSGASGTFGGGSTTQTVSTGPNGVATSSPITANLTPGAWVATATVPPVTTPARFALTNVPSPTATHLTASRDPATPTEQVTFTANVTAASPSAGTPNGSVQFKVDGADLGGPVALSEGSATSIPISGLAPGARDVEALYAGTVAYLPSTGTLELPVEKTTTATQVTSSLNPALPTENVTFTATISVPPGNEPYDGTVQFSVDGNPLGAPQPASNGTATSPAFSTVTVGQHPVLAITAEDADYLGSKGEMTEVVDPDGTAVTVDSSVNPAEYGAALELEATVTPRPPVVLTPTGTVQFSVEGSGCTGTLAAGTTACAPAAALSPGEHEVDAHYSGDSDFEPSDGTMVQKVFKARTVTSVVGDPAGDAIYGEPVSFAAAVARLNSGTGTPTGTVQFALGGTPFGPPAPLEAGDADSDPVTPNAGAHVVTAGYGGDGNFAASTGTAPYRVLPAPTSIALTSAPEPSQPEEDVTITAAVTAGTPIAEPPIPEGEIQFRVDGLDFGSPVPLVNGRADSLPAKDLEPGRHEIEAIYDPANANFQASHKRGEHDVDQPTTTTLASTTTSPGPGEPVTVVAHVGPLVADGTVSFQVDGVPAPVCQAIPIADEDADCTLTGLAAGTHRIRATYSGAPLFDPSEGNLTLNVGSATCQLREVRGRLLVYRSRDAVRLTTRYRATAPGRVKVRFFARRAGGRRGPMLATLNHRFEKESRKRHLKKLSGRKMGRLRRANGFVASFDVQGDPGYCAQRFSRQLTIRRQVDDQQVWFQADSKRLDLPPDSR